jgi:acetyl-CoA carboxylase carboxyl transferase subunit alpha
VTPPPPPPGGKFVKRIATRIAHPFEEGGHSAWEAVTLARHADRPYPLDYIARMCSDFEEIHGDRNFGEDPAMVCGIGRYHGEPIAIMGQQKGRDTQERTHRNFGMASPEGYRKAMRLMAIAEKLDMPVLTLIDTPGAFPGAGGETRGQGGAIARSIAAMVRIRPPSIAVIVGEGSSGGALGIGVADRVLMLENATYSVISPEGGAAILWRDAAKAKQAAAAFRPTAANCYRLGIVDAVVPEPKGGAHKDHEEAARILDGYVTRALRELRAIPGQDRRRQRRDRFRRIGAMRELPTGGAAMAAGVEDLNGAR